MSEIDKTALEREYGSWANPKKKEISAVATNPDTTTDTVVEKLNKKKLTRRDFLKGVGIAAGAAAVGALSEVNIGVSQAQEDEGSHEGEDVSIEQEQNAEAVPQAMADMLDTLYINELVESYDRGRNETTYSFGETRYMNTDELHRFLPRNEITAPLIDIPKNPTSYATIELKKTLPTAPEVTFQIAVEDGTDATDGLVYREEYNEQTGAWSRRARVTIDGEKMAVYSNSEGDASVTSFTSGQELTDAYPDQASVDAVLNKILPENYLRKKYGEDHAEGNIFSEPESSDPEKNQPNMRKLLDTLDPDLQIAFGNAEYGTKDKDTIRLSKHAANDLSLFHRNEVTEHALQNFAQVDEVAITAQENRNGKTFRISINWQEQGFGPQHEALGYYESVEPNGEVIVSLGYVDGNNESQLARLSSSSIDSMQIEEKQEAIRRIKMFMPEPKNKEIAQLLQ